MKRRRTAPKTGRAKPGRKPGRKPRSKARNKPRPGAGLKAHLKARTGVHPKRTALPGPQPDVEDSIVAGVGRAGTAQGNPLLKAAGRFHGHIGPFLALGMKMGLVANEVIGRDPFGVVTEVTVEIRPPRGCLLDGIQYATGCTMGKGNIRVTPHPVMIWARFERGSRAITVTVREDLVARMESELAGMSEKAIIDYAFRIMDTPAGDLFEVT
jgi:formylmethanofuran dehydrogenase subunit E